MVEATVTQADREAAWPFVPANSIAGTNREGFFNGGYDGAAIVQAFARHRTAASQASGAKGWRAESIKNAVVDLPFANTAPIEWDDADWHGVRRALATITAPPTSDAEEAK